MSTGGTKLRVNNLGREEFNNPKIRVINRQGTDENFDKQRIRNRLKFLIRKEPSLDQNVINVEKIISVSIDQSFDRIKTTELDKLTSEICAYKGIEYPEYSMLASRIEISNLHKNLVLGPEFNIWKF